MKLEEHRYKKQFDVTIVRDMKKARHPVEDEWYLLRVPPEPATEIGTQFLIFHPEYIRDSHFDRVLLDRQRREGVIYKIRPSMRELLLSANSMIRSVLGRVHQPSVPDAIQKDVLEDEDISLIAFGVASRP